MWVTIIRFNVIRKIETVIKIFLLPKIGEVVVVIIF